MKYSEDVFAYVFEEIFRFCEIESQKAENRKERNRMKYSEDVFAYVFEVAYSEGQMLGYERVCRKIKQLKAYIESIEPKQNGESK